MIAKFKLDLRLVFFLVNSFRDERNAFYLMVALM